jgi:hypothetical protein
MSMNIQDFLNEIDAAAARNAHTIKSQQHFIMHIDMIMSIAPNGIKLNDVLEKYKGRVNFEYQYKIGA